MNLLWHRHDEGIDRSSLENLSMRIGEGSHRRLIIVTRENEMNLRLSSSIGSTTGEDENLIEISIGRMIVGQSCHTQLDQRETDRTFDHPEKKNELL